MMSRIELFAFALCICASAVNAQKDLISSIACLGETESTSVSSEEPVTATPAAATEEESEEKEVCFRYLGCFSLEKPWKSALRPIPAPMDPKEIPVRMLFYSRPNVEEEHVIETYPDVNLGYAPFDPNKTTVIITHGYSNNGSAEWLHDLKDAYLSKVNANALITDWGPGAQRANYLQVTGNTRVVGRLVANVLKHLQETRGLDVKKVHLIGHSLGAQISSYVAKEVPGIARLTALDPAQPAFETFDKQVRLDKSDADFVDVIHTDAKPFIPFFGFGMIQPHGHVDFYMNGGFKQPGCIVPEKLPEVTGILDLLKMPVEYISEIKTCNHGRAHQYLIEAFNETDSCIFWGRPASAENVARTLTNSLTHGLFARYIAKNTTCTKETCVPLGFGTPLSPLRGTFVVNTENRPPYCIPEPGILSDTPIEETTPQPQGGFLGSLSRSPIGKALKGLVSLVR